MNRQLLSLARRAVLAPQTATKSAVRQSSAYKPPAWWTPGHMNELPIPQGSWQAAYEAQQRKYNIHLIVGVSFFAFTLFVMKTSGLVVLNSQIPSLPGEHK